MAKKRVHEIAKAQGVSSKELLAALKAAGVEAKAAASSVEEQDALKALSGANGGGGNGAPAAAKPAPAKASAPPKAVQKATRDRELWAAVPDMETLGTPEQASGPIDGLFV